jgi:PD-(D/E)XK nuclease superfamily
VIEQFGLRTMHGRTQLVSLFYYMGMLTFAEASRDAADPVLVIPNLVIRELQWEYLALALKDQEGIWMDTLSLSSSLAAMAMKGDIEPLLTQFREQVVARIGNKDLRQFNEKILKLMLLAYISQSRMFKILSEKEFSGGYCDIFLGLTGEVPAAKYAWMLEVKYLKTQAKPVEIKRAFEEAHTQLERYTSDKALVPLLTLGKELKAGALVFVGAKDVLFQPWPPLEAPKGTQAKKAKKAPKAKTTARG